MTADKNASKTRERVVFPTMTNGRLGDLPREESGKVHTFCAQRCTLYVVPAISPPSRESGGGFGGGGQRERGRSAGRAMTRDGRFHAHA